jgi:predicted DNA repair protein MutK
MAGASLLTLLDDIATLLDDIALMSKTAAKKTAGVLGDDLALNAQQVSGVKADRELPVVWAVAKGSLFNKLILVPSALLISAFLPFLITPLLMLGGLFLCFEGAEKIIEKLFHSAPEHDSSANLQIEDRVEYEQDKIKGAIRTDFILSAEIIVIALGTVAQETFTNQLAVLSVIAVLMTLGVYGLVALIVKLDDMGLYLLAKPDAGSVTKAVGRGLLAFAPKLMKLLAIAGTLAMFMVGGGILTHGWHFVSEYIDAMSVEIASQSLTVLTHVLPSVFSALFGLIAGIVVVMVISTLNWCKTKISR